VSRASGSRALASPFERVAAPVRPAWRLREIVSAGLDDRRASNGIFELMRSVLLVSVLVVGSVVHADPAAPVRVADPAAPVRAAIDGAQDYLSEQGPLHKFAGVWLLGPDGLPITNRFDDALIAFRHNEPPRVISGIEWKLGALTLGTDETRGIAWFQAPASLVIQLPYGMGCCDTLPATLRTSGIVVRDAKDQPWHLVALAFSRQLSDAALFRGATEHIPQSGVPLDDGELSKQVVTWFPTTGDTLLGRNAATGCPLVVSGTGPSEYATGAAAGKLVAAWDKLGIRANTIDSKMFAGNTIGLVKVAAGLWRKKAAAPMVLYAIAIRDSGGKWKWVSLQWTTELAKPPPAPPETNGSEPAPHAP